MMLLLAVISLSAPCLASARIFGSDGFDSGGNGATCFRSVYDPANIPQDASSIDTDSLFASSPTQAASPNDPRAIESINEALYEKTVGEIDTEILPSCYAGTNLTVEPPEKLRERTLTRGIDYDFRVRLAIDIRETYLGLKETEDGGNNDVFRPPDSPVLVNPEVVVCWFRLVMCSAFEVGFCSPFLQSAGGEDSPVRRRRRISEREMQESNPYQYEQGTPLEGVPSGANDEFVSTRWVSWKLRADSNEQDIYQAMVDLTMVLPMEGNQDGVYFFLAHAVLYIRKPNGTAYRLDIADSLPNNIVTVKSPPRIYRVTEEFTIGISVLIGVFGMTSLAALVFIIRNKYHQIMVLSQANLLAGLTACGLWSIVFSFLYIPLYDTFCRIRGPVVLIPMTVMGAISVARLWRVYSTLNVALALGRSANAKTKGPSLNVVAEDRVMSILSRFAYFRLPFMKREEHKISFKERRSSLRQKINPADTIYLVVILSLPQVILQVFEAAYFHSEVIIEFDSTGQIGREMCYAENSIWTMYLGVVLLAMMHILAVLVAWFSRNLPSAFNEKDAIFHAAAINGVVCMIIIALLFVTDGPSTSPNLTALLWIILTITLTFVSNFHLVLPKIKRVMSKEKVIISNMLRRMNNDPSDTSDLEGSTNGKASTENISGLDFSPRSSKVSFMDGTSEPAIKVRRIKLKPEDPIPKSVENEMHSLKELLESVTSKALEGRQIDFEDWIVLKTKAGTFHTEVGRVDCEWNSSTEAAPESIEL